MKLIALLFTCLCILGIYACSRVLCCGAHLYSSVYIDYKDTNNNPLFADSSNGYNIDTVRVFAYKPPYNSKQFLDYNGYPDRSGIATKGIVLLAVADSTLYTNSMLTMYIYLKPNVYDTLICHLQGPFDYDYLVYDSVWYKSAGKSDYFLYDTAFSPFNFHLIIQK